MFIFSHEALAVFNLRLVQFIAQYFCRQVLAAAAFHSVFQKSFREKRSPKVFRKRFLNSFSLIYFFFRVCLQFEHISPVRLEPSKGTKTFHQKANFLNLIYTPPSCKEPFGTGLNQFRAGPKGSLACFFEKYKEFLNKSDIKCSIFSKSIYNRQGTWEIFPD